MQIRHPEFRHGAQHAPQHLGARQGQHDVKAVAGGRRVLTVNRQGHPVVVHSGDDGLAKVAAHHTGPQGITH